MVVTSAGVFGSALPRTGSTAVGEPVRGARRALPFAPTLSPEIESAKKNAFIMIPYGMFVLGVADGAMLHAAAINWVMQSAYREPQFTMGVRRPGGYGMPFDPALYDDRLYAALVTVRRFALSFLGSDQAQVARAFMKPTRVDAGTINGQAFQTRMTGAPILATAPAWFEASIENSMEAADHTLFLCKVFNAGNTVERPLLMDRDATTRPKGWLPQP